MRSLFSPQTTTLYILAGGKSSRFGEDKARYKLDGKALIQRVLEGFPNFFDIKAVVKKGDNFDDFNLDCIHDQHGDGPLSGIHAALKDAKTDWIFVVPCDTLGFSSDWLLEFSDHQEKAIAFHNERWFPLFSAFHKDALAQIEENLDTKNFAIWKTLDDLDAKKIPTPVGWEDLLRIDYKSDLK